MCVSGDSVDLVFEDGEQLTVSSGDAVLLCKEWSDRVSLHFCVCNFAYFVCVSSGGDYDAVLLCKEWSNRVSLYVCTYVCITCRHACRHAYIQNTHIYMPYMYISVCMYVCMYVCTYMHIFRYNTGGYEPGGAITYIWGYNLHTCIHTLTHMHIYRYNGGCMGLVGL